MGWLTWGPSDQLSIQVPHQGSPGLPAPGLPGQLLCLLCPRGGSTESHALMKGLLRGHRSLFMLPWLPGGRRSPGLPWTLPKEAS